MNGDRMPEEELRRHLERRAHGLAARTTTRAVEEEIRQAVRARVATEPQGRAWPRWLGLGSDRGLPARGPVAVVVPIFALVVVLAGGALLLTSDRSRIVGQGPPGRPSASAPAPVAVPQSTAASGLIDPMDRTLSVAELIAANANPSLRGQIAIVHGTASAPVAPDRLTQVAITDGSAVQDLLDRSTVCPAGPPTFCVLGAQLTVAVSLAGDGSTPHVLGVIDPFTDHPGFSVDGLVQYQESFDPASNFPYLSLVNGWLDGGLAIPCPIPLGGFTDTRFACGVAAWLTSTPFQATPGGKFMPANGIRAQNNSYSDFAPSPAFTGGAPEPREGTFLVRWGTCPPGTGCFEMPAPTIGLPVEIIARVNPITISAQSSGTTWDPGTRSLGPAELATLADRSSEGLLAFGNRLLTVHGQLVFFGPGGCVSGPCLGPSWSLSGADGIDIKGVDTSLAGSPATWVLRITGAHEMTILGPLNEASSTSSAWDVARLASAPVGLLLVRGRLQIGDQRPCASPTPSGLPPCYPYSFLTGPMTDGTNSQDPLIVNGDTPTQGGDGLFLIRTFNSGSCPTCAGFGVDALLGRIDPLTIPGS